MRAPHGTPEYEVDNTMVWDILRTGTHGTQAYTWIKTHAAARNGREAYLSLTIHYLGSAANESMLAKAESAVENTFYKGEKARFNFEKYVSIHRDAYNDMETVPGYAIPDDGTRVRKLLHGIQDPKLDAAVAAIKAAATLRNDFEEAVDFIKTFVLTTTTANDYNVSSFSQDQGGGRGRGRGGYHGGHGRGGGRGRGRGRGGYGGRGRGRGRGGGRGRGLEVSDRYYSPEEFYNTLTDSQRTEVLRLRSERDDRRTVAAVDTPATATTATTNTTNPALQRNNTNQRSRVAGE
jgi:hypothetical protein